MLKGSDVLALIERTLLDSRKELENVDVRLSRSTAEHERLRQMELGALAVLARIRVREIERGELLEELDETGRRVREILAQRAQAEEKLAAEIEAENQTLAKIEEARVAQHDAVDAADKVVDEAEAEAQRQLAADTAFQAKLEAARASDAVADLAESKAQAARKDRIEKGKPYEADPLFAYLWQRGYGTLRYRAGALTRLLDGWVARVCGFERLRQDYWVLSELPARFDTHAERMRALADEDVAAVHALEQKAAEAAGVPARSEALTAAEAELKKIDETIDAKEKALAALVEQRGRFAAGDDDLSRQCTALLSDALRKESMRSLRERATRTPNPEDDAAVDQLTVVRAELPRVVDEVTRYRSLHGTHRDRAQKLEELRRRFKEQKFDAVGSEFVNSALIATLLTQLVAGALGVPDIWDALTKQHRVRRLAADPTFGSGRWPRGRGGRGPWRGPRGGGGFGGGFGGGGFRTGGGFGGGGGFRTGGGF